ncbi:hypothetical protein BdWA1_001956 [Babesia duncani]|uniref:Uncharacterized protein n=1 Tax=Babesia duncani TaxID=323732 RepID=A0AAD9UPB3_9APIC|nr:hypothetical protein BdWA1_001956 [Babesia duncani]
MTMGLDDTEEGFLPGSSENDSNVNVQIDDVYRQIPPTCGTCVDIQDHEDTCRCYFYGQLANGTKCAIWWSMIGFLSNQLIQSSIGITLVACVFNLALMFSSLFNGLVAEVVPIKYLLCFTIVVRALIWVFFIPFSWFFWVSFLECRIAFISSFIFWIALDGITVGLSNTCDLVYDGVDRISHQYDLVIPQGMHSQMGNTYQIIFDLSFGILLIPIGVVMYSIGEIFKEGLIVVALVGGSIFFVLSCLSLCFYLKGMNGRLSASYLSDVQEITLSMSTITSEICSRLLDIKDGMKIAYLQTGLLKNVIILAVLTAFEDSITLLVIPVIAQTNIWFENPSPHLVNLLGICFIALGKIGGFANGLYISYRYNEAELLQTQNSSRLVRKFLSFSAIAMLLLQGSIVSLKIIPNCNWLSIILMGFGILSFYACTAFPKVVTSSAVQSTISNHPLSYKLFDFVDTFTIIVNIVILLLLTGLCLHSNSTFNAENIVFHTGAAYIVIQLIISIWNKCSQI